MMAMLHLPVKDARKTMECPICLEIPIDTPIVLCATGHSFCTPCRQKLKNCSLCGAQFTNTRNYALETMVQVAQFTCKFREQGCFRVINGTEIERHQKECNFGVVLCSYDDVPTPCVNKRIDVAHWIDHLLTHHYVSRTDNERGNFSFKDRSSLLTIPLPPVVLCLTNIDGKEFLLNRVVDNQIVHWWFSLFGRTEEASAYTAVMTLKAPPVKKGLALAKIDFTVPIHSFRDSFATVKGTGGFAAFPTEYLKSYSSRVHPLAGKHYYFDWNVQCRITKKQETEVGAKRQKLVTTSSEADSSSEEDEVDSKRNKMMASSTEED